MGGDAGRVEVTDEMPVGYNALKDRVFLRGVVFVEWR